MFLGWYDPDKKKPTTRKVQEAVNRYCQKWSEIPRVLLINPSQAHEIWGEEVHPTGIEIRAVAHVAPNTFFVGTDELPELEGPVTL